MFAVQYYTLKLLKAAATKLSKLFTGKKTDTEITEFSNIKTKMLKNTSDII